MNKNQKSPHWMRETSVFETFKARADSDPWPGVFTKVLAITFYKAN